jgi:hypothetical protein
MIRGHLKLFVPLGIAVLLGTVGSGGCGSAHNLSGFNDAGSQVLDSGSTYDGGSLLPPEDASLVDNGGFSQGDGGGTHITGLYFMPPSATVTVTSANMVVPFTLMAKQQSGPDFAVTPSTAIFTRQDIASMAIGNPVNLTVSGQALGSGVLQGIYGGAGATATLTVTAVNLSNVGTGVDPTAPGTLNSATTPDPSAGISPLLYPYDKTVFPLGLVSPLVMWNAPKSGDVYRLHYEEPNFTCDDYEVVNTPAQMRMGQSCWDWMTSNNKGDPIQVKLSRWDAATKMAYVSATESWTLAHENMQGAVYYWTTASPTDAYLARLPVGAGPMGAPMAQPLTVGGTQVCMACHAVSADGSTLVAVAGDIGMPAFPGETTSGTPGYCATAGTCQEDLPTDDRAWISFDLNPTSPALTQRKMSNLFGGNVAVNPDGKYTVFGDVQLYLADTTTGMFYTGTGLDNVVLGTSNVGLMMPAFSPDGNHLVAVEGPADPSGQPSFITLAGATGDLLALNFNEGTRTFSNPTRFAQESTLPVGQSAIAYPSYTPDAKWVAFHSGDKPTACENTCDATETSNGAIYLANTAGGAPVRMAALTDTPTVPTIQQNHTFEPTFDPVARGGYFWVVVSNERDWGNKITVGAGKAPANANKRLWVAAVDSTPGTTDPSHPPFYLEGQDPTRLNMRGFWANAPCIPTGQGTCGAGFECCSGYCNAPTCVDIGNTMPTCIPLGGACGGSEAGAPAEGGASGDGGATLGCCGAPQVQCLAGICQIPMSQ